MSIEEKDLPAEWFQPTCSYKSEISKKPTHTLTYSQDVWLRVKKNKGVIVGSVLLLCLTLLAIFGPMMNNYGFDDQDLSRAKLPPRVQGLENFEWLGLSGKGLEGENIYKQKGIDEYYWFGTDGLGRDLWTRTWQGTRISLYIALLAAFIDMVIGVAYGGISAYYGGKVDNFMQRIIEILVGIPNLIVVILMILILKPGIISITIALTITGWISMARVVRGQVLKLKNQEYILAARTLGASNTRIIVRHLVPNLTGIIIINTMFTIPSAIFFEAFLSFIGLGLQPPIASLGTLINDGFSSMHIYPHIMIFPAVIISLIMIGFNIFADGLRDVLDPKMRD